MFAVAALSFDVIYIYIFVEILSGNIEDIVIFYL